MVKESRNQLAGYLVEVRVVNRIMPVSFTRPFGRVRELWHRDMWLRITVFGIDLVSEEQYRKIQEGDSEEVMGELRMDDEESRFMFQT